VGVAAPSLFLSRPVAWGLQIAASAAEQGDFVGQLPAQIISNSLKLQTGSPGFYTPAPFFCPLFIQIKNVEA